MIKKLIVLLALVAALWTIPAVRERMASAAVPLLEKLDPNGERLLAPAHRWAARHDVGEVVKSIKHDGLEGRRPPDANSFAAYVRSRLEDDGLDPWGRGYWLERKGRSITVGSSGPDGRRGNADDITKSAEF